MDEIERRIAQRHFKPGEGILQIYTEDPDGEMYDSLLRQGREICASLPGDKVSLYFVDGVRCQAGADSELKTVMVWKGMLDLIIKLASLLTVHARPIPPAYQASPLPWRHDVKVWLKDGVFDWESPDYWWLRDPEYRATFETFAFAIFCFILLHEVGHFHNLHAVRRAERGASPEAEAADDQERLEKHAREVIADTYAMQFLMDELKKRLFADETHYDPHKHIAITQACFTFALIAASATLWGFSVAIPMDESHQENSYPGHAFRLRAIQSTALEHRINGLEPHTAHYIISTAMKQCAEIMSVLSGGDFVTWDQALQNPIHGAHYEKVCEEVRNWSNPFYGSKD